MQKLDFVINLETIAEKLQSNEIVRLFETGFIAPQEPGRYDLINPLLFLSKSNFDQIKSDDKYKDILTSLGADTILEEKNLSYLTTMLRQTKAHDILLNKNTVAFYNFHKSILLTLKLAEDVLTNETTQKSIEENINDGIIIFQIVIEGDGLETETYIKIFGALQELVITLSKIYGETEQKPEIILLDSGSDTNLGLKSGAETAKSLFLIFKEIWDFIIGFRHYKQKQRNQELLESLTIRAEIKKKVDEGVITSEEGIQYNHMVKTRTDDLIGMKVLPKAIVLENSKIENKKLLQEFEGLKMLTSGENMEDKSNA